MVKKLQTKLLLLVGLMLAGVSTAWAGEEVFYTLDTSSATGNNNAYNSDGFVDVNGITWYCEGNMTTKPWRVGGKSITKTNRNVWTTTAMSETVSKVDLTVGAASNITVNSLTLTVASDDEFANVIETQTLTFVSNSTITATPSAGKEWTNAYFKYTFNVTVSGSSNKFVEFSKVQFYKEVADDPRTPTTLSIADVTVAQDDMVELVVNTNSDATVTYEVANPAIADIEEGYVVGYAVGTTTVVATQTGSNNYKDASCTFTITVTKAPHVAAFNEVFYESFDSNDGTGGNDGSWSGSIASSDISCDNTSAWDFTNGSGASQCAKFGTGSKKGSAALTLDLVPGFYELSFLAGAWDGSKENTTITLSAEGATVGQQQASTDIELTKGEFNEFTQYVEVNEAGTVTLTFAASNASNNRFFLDEVSLKVNALKKEVLSFGWATFIPAYNVEFAEGEAYIVTDASVADGLTLEEVAAAPAGTPVLLKGTGEKSFGVVESAQAPEGSLLKVSDGQGNGSLYPYVLAKDGESASFKQWTGDIADIEGYPVLWLDEAAAARTIYTLGGETDGIANVSTKTTAGNAFDLQGRRVAQPTKGLYIVNGKKIIVK